MKTLLKLQELDAKISTCRNRETEIPKQKIKFNTIRERLKAELAERELVCQNFELEQRECESEIELRKAQIDKYNEQLNAVKKNDEYQALLHEIDQVKKQIGVKEERIITILLEQDDAKARLEEDRKRIQEETKELDVECGEIDTELVVAVKQRDILVTERDPLLEQVAGALVSRYTRLRKKYRSGTVVVPLRGEVCTGCNMHVLPQVANEVLEGNKVHSCQHCGRILYHPGNVEDVSATAEEAATQ